MVDGWIDVALGLSFLGLGAFAPMRSRRTRKPLHPAYRLVYVVLGLSFIVLGLVRAF